MSSGPPLDPEPDARPDAISVLAVGDGDPVDLVEARLSSADGFEVTVAPGPPAECQVDPVDCVVVTTGSGNGTEEGTPSGADGTPVLHVTDGSRERTDSDDGIERITREAVLADEELLATRVRAIVETRRTATVARRALGAMGALADGVAIVGQGGEFRFANRSFERLFGYDEGELDGRPWQTVFAPCEVRKIERTVLSMAREGWRWRGTCEGRQASGDPVTVDSSVVGLEDGSLAFVVSRERSGEDGVSR